MPSMRRTRPQSGPQARPSAISWPPAAPGRRSSRREPQPLLPQGPRQPRHRAAACSRGRNPLPQRRLRLLRTMARLCLRPPGNSPVSKTPSIAALRIPSFGSTRIRASIISRARTITGTPRRGPHVRGRRQGGLRSGGEERAPSVGRASRCPSGRGAGLVGGLGRRSRHFSAAPARQLEGSG